MNTWHFFFLFFLPSGANALLVPNVLSSGLVLQRGAATIWGKSDCSSVTISHFDDNGALLEAKNVPADPGDTIFETRLSFSEPAEGHRITIEENCVASQVTLTINDVFFGDVYSCMGQSNMYYGVRYFNDNAQVLAEVVPEDYKLRFWTSKKGKSPTPNFNMPSEHPSPIWLHGGDANNLQSTYTSATCFHTMKNIFDYHNKEIPIGFVSMAYGGTSLEHWSTEDALSDTTCGGLTNTTYLRNAPNDDHQVWNFMAHPMKYMTFSATFWYQGEKNAGRAGAYACNFPAFIQDYRSKFLNLLNDAPFYLVLLAGLTTPQDHSKLRAAQLNALNLPNIGVANIQDIGNRGDIHPNNKREVGRRLSLFPLRDMYRVPRIVTNGPVVDYVEYSCDRNRMIIAFQQGTAVNLVFEGSATCTTCCRDSPVRFHDGSSWVRTTYLPRIVGNKLEVDIPVTNPTKISLQYESFNQCSLYSDYGGLSGKNVALPFEIDITIS